MDCLYRIYEQTFLLARETLLGGDARALRDLSGAAEDREVSEAMAALLALSDVKRGSPQRPVTQVCRALGAFCPIQVCGAGDRARAKAPGRSPSASHRAGDRRAWARPSAR